MDNRITSAYQQFSTSVQRRSHSNEVQSKDQIKPTAKERTKPSGSVAQLSQTEKQQIQQLRQTGTLDNLRAILNQEEEQVLKKLFPEMLSSYDANANRQLGTQKINHVKGDLFDTKL